MDFVYRPFFFSMDFFVPPSGLTSPAASSPDSGFSAPRGQKSGDGRKWRALSSLKLTFSHLKMDGWKTMNFPLGAISAYFQVQYVSVQGGVIYK